VNHCKDFDLFWSDEIDNAFCVVEFLWQELMASQKLTNCGAIMKMVAIASLLRRT